MDESRPGSGAEPVSERVKVRRSADRGRYNRADVLEILDAGLIAHVGVSTPDGPLVLPMAYGHDDDRLYLHGAIANHLLGIGDGQEICVTVTCLDGLVMARTPFHNSMNYRSVVVRGHAQRITDDERRLAALKLVTDHIAEIWDSGRPPSKTDLHRTLVLEMPLTESSAKVRRGDPLDEPEDIAGPWWAGVVPITTHFEPPVASADLAGDTTPPSTIAALSDRTTDDRPRLKHD